MSKAIAIVGLPAVLRKIAGTATAAAATVEARCKRAGLFIQRESQKIVPVQFGPLKASAFTRAEGTGLKVKVYVGYTAAYAIYVHENLDALHGAAFNAAYADRIIAAKKAKSEYTKAKSKATRTGTTPPKLPKVPPWKIWFNRGPNQTSKFLERPIREQRSRLRAIMEGK